MVQVKVRSKTPGAGDGIPDVLVELASERTTTRQLIGRALEEQSRLLEAGGAQYGSAL